MLMEVMKTDLKEMARKLWIGFSWFMIGTPVCLFIPVIQTLATRRTSTYYLLPRVPWNLNYCNFVAA
jgi:hypothetical protein